jgi:glycosyltransferase involved in cell wall biosynthesis
MSNLLNTLNYLTENRNPQTANRIKVLHLLASLPVGGAEDLVAAMVRGLDAARFDVQAAAIGPVGVVGEELRRAGYPVHSLGLDLKGDPDLKIVLHLRRLLKDLKPDILHTHLYHPNYYGRLAALGLGLKGVVASVHNSYTTVKFHRRVWNYLLGLVTDRILVSSPQVWQDVHRYDAAPPAKLQIIPYGIRLEELDQDLTPADAKDRLGVSGFCLGVVGRLEEQKGHRFLLEALPHLAREISDLNVLLIGDGRLREDLQRQVRELKVEHRVNFLGTRRDLPLLFRAMDVFVQPSLWEGLPLALLMAMGAGLPPVATRVSGVMEVIEDGVNGRLASPGDSQALAAAIADLARQPHLREQMGDAARQTVAEHYSQPAMLKKLAALYLELYEGEKGEKGKRRTTNT